MKTLPPNDSFNDLLMGRTRKSKPILSIPQSMIYNVTNARVSKKKI